MFKPIKLFYYFKKANNKTKQKLKGEIDNYVF
jgi:hypothetical protein